MKNKIECSKVKFSNEANALFYIKKLNATSKRVKVPVRAYLCEYCLSWHLTSMTDKEQTLLQKYKEKIKILGLEIQNRDKKIIELNNRIKKQREKYL